MGQAEIIIDMVQCQLLPHAVLALAQCADSPSNRGHMLPDGEVEALHKRRLDLPAAGRQHLLDRLQRAKYDSTPYADQPPAPHGLDHLRIKQLGQWHPARLRSWTLGPLAWWVHPVPIVG